MRKEEKEKLSFRFVSLLPGAEWKMQKKKQKKSKNTIMASFQTNRVWKRPRKRENKNYRFVPFLPDALWKIPKNSKKIPLWQHFKPK